MTSKELIETLQLLPHPEGGFYKETYRSSESLMNERQQERSVSTAIYYLLEKGDMSALHRIKSDELWFFHQGEPLEIVSIEGGAWQVTILGNDVSQGEVPQALVPANTWFGARVKNNKGYSLVSCMVAPGFDFSDFEMGMRNELVQKFPTLHELIEEFTRS